MRPHLPLIGLKRPLTVEEYHAIVRKVFAEIVTFNASGREGSISTGATVFGWTDQRRVDNGLLKFSLTKLNKYLSPEIASLRAWNILTTPGGYIKVISQNMNLRTEIVQVVDHSNVVIWQEYQVHSNTTVTIVRSLTLLTLFGTGSGHTILHYGLDPELAKADYLRDENVNNAWQPVFCWSGFDHVEGAFDQCYLSFVGTFPVDGVNFASWAVEVLLLLLLFESFLIGLQWALPLEQ